MPPVGESKWRRTAHAHCNTVIRNPHRGFLSEFHDLFVPLLHSLHNNENIKRIQIVKIIRRGLQNLVNVNGKMEKRPLFKKILKPTKNVWDTEGVWVTPGVNDSDREVSTRRRNPKFGIFRVTSSEREKKGGGLWGEEIGQPRPENFWESGNSTERWALFKRFTLTKKKNESRCRTKSFRVNSFFVAFHNFSPGNMRSEKTA